MNIFRAGDLVYAFRIVKLLTTPWDKQEAFKYGIIDKNGTLLRKSDTLKTPEEKGSYTYLHRIVFNLKRLLGLVPGGKSFAGAAAASLLLLKEELDEVNLSDDAWQMILDAIMELEEDTPTNVSGAAVSTDTPKPMRLHRRNELTQKKDDVKV